jgi:hypothetical protein|tara:strand:- start:457 stop:999 length:543 start_codon:yes stop_codon:yes gene_type:complete
MASVYDIIKGLNQAAANAYDGSHMAGYNADGEERKVGLRREEGDPITDSRVMDGFKVRISGPKCIVTYQSEMPMKDFHNTKIEDEIEQIYADIAKFLKKEYKAITKETLSLTPDGPCEILMQNMSKVRTWAQCNKVYTIGNMTDVLPVGEPSEDRLEDNFRKFLELDTDKKPKNVTRKSD